MLQETQFMSTVGFMISVLFLTVSGQSFKTSCEIPSVEAGDVATLTTHFGQDLSTLQVVDYTVLHLKKGSKELKMLSCVFSYGNVTCDKTSCCTWESHVTDVFRVYIRNVSQELEGKFWGLLTPADGTYQKSCNFTLKAFTCPTNLINASNSQMTCSNQPVTLCQTCTVTCIPGYYFQENQNSLTYTCVGKNKWFPEIPVRSCEAYTCPADIIKATNGRVICSSKHVTIGQTCTVICSPGHYSQDNHTSVTYTCVGKNKWSPQNLATHCEAYTCSRDTIIAKNSHLICSSQPVTIGQTCMVACNPGHYFHENQTSITYTCVGKHKWSPELSVVFCEAKGQSANTYFLFLLIVIPVVIIMAILFKKWYTQKRRKIKEELASSINTHISDWTSYEDSTSDEMEHMLTEGSTKYEDQQLVISAENYWLQCIKTWYPEFHSKSYFLPPLHFNQEQFTMKYIAGKEVHVPEITQSIPHTHYDRALQRVLRGIHALADNGQKKEVMFVVSQLQFGNYLGDPTFAPAAALLPRPSTLPEDLRKQHFDKGDFDVLIIHSQHGLFTLQISSVGEDFKSQQTMTDQEEVVSRQTITDQEEDALIKKVEEAANQLNKAEVVLKHLTSDLEPEINITKCIVLPNITTSQLKRANEKSPSTGKFLRECLGVKSVVDAVKLCLQKDQLSDNQTSSDINPSSVQALREWWQHVVRVSRSGSSLTSSLYEQLVARFCGPATTVEVHCVTAPRLNITTQGEAVSETGERVARLVLFPQQVDILNQSPPRAFLSGPPGTGKNIVLIMQGLTWIRRGHDVHVVSTWGESRAATFVIEHQLQETAKTSTARSRVHRHQFDFWKDGEVKTAVSCLKSLSEGRQLCVIADEAVGDDRNSFTEFCDQLIIEVSGVFIWGASLYNEVRPKCLEEFKLTTPLRSPPVVVREVMKAWEIKNKEVDDYTVNDVPVPTDGPPVKRIKHRKGQSGHTGFMPIDCVKCGHEVARVLRELNVGQTGNINGPPPLQYRDVLVVCEHYPTDDRVDNKGQVIRTASGLVRGLRDSHVPVRVEDGCDEAAIRDMALGVSDLVTVANCNNVHGLERKVVVVENVFDLSVRLHAMSRCTSQLVILSTRMTHRFRHHLE